MAKGILASCCGCIELRTGCFFLGYLQVFGNISTIGKILLMAATASQLDKERTEKDTGLPFAGFLALLMLVPAVNAAFTITFLVGLHKMKRRLVLVYLCYITTAMALVTIAGLVTMAIYRFYIGIIFYAIVVAPTVYFIMVIRSYYYEMDDSSANREEVFNDVPLARTAGHV